MRRLLALGLLLPCFSLGSAPEGDATRLYLKGSGWFQFGRIMHSSDTLSPTFNYNGNWVQNSGAQFTVIADIDEHWQGAMGLGGLQFHSAPGKEVYAYRVNPGFAPYITEARFSWSLGARDETPLAVNFGLFPYQYNTDVRNLGAYLFRGPVYPGVVFSEFESKSIDTTVGNILGIQVRNNLGGFFTQDLILRSETEFPPVFDFSLAYVAEVRMGKVLELGAGANFYRIIPMQAGATKLTDRSAFKINLPGPGGHPYDGNYAYFDSLTGDTLLLSHQGIKLMGRMAFDPKPWFGEGPLGPRDLQLYAEAAVIGTKDYKGVYDDIKERIPVTVGFVIPTFGLLDELTVEAEWYGAPFRDDYLRLMTDASPMPRSNSLGYARPRVADSLGNIDGTKIKLADPYDVTRMRKDNWKWSLYLSRSFQDRVKVSLQAANDHFRPNTPLNSDPTTTERMESSFTTLKDWYLMFRMGFFF